MVGVRRPGATWARRPWQQAVAAEGEDQPGGADAAGQRATEGRDHRADRDDVADPRRHVQPAEVADQRLASRRTRLTSLRRRAEAHRLDGGHDDEVDAAEDGDAEDRARDVARWALGLLAERRRGLEAGEGQEAEHDPEEHRAQPGVPGGTLNTDQSTPSLPGPECPASLANTITMTITISSTVIPSAARTTRVPPRAGVVASHQTSSEPGRAEQEPSPGRLVLPDADVAQEPGREPAAGHRGDDRVEDVRARPAPSPRSRPLAGRAWRRRSRTPSRNDGSAASAARTCTPRTARRRTRGRTRAAPPGRSSTPSPAG